jgi:hypothetical protein
MLSNRIGPFFLCLVQLLLLKTLWRKNHQGGGPARFRQLSAKMPESNAQAMPPVAMIF